MIMKETVRKHTISMKHAIDGLLWAYKTQPNYRVHVFILLVVIAAGIFFNVSYVEWLVLTLTIMLGLIIETLNTAIESTTDAITREWKEEIKIAKDVAAAAMLTHAIGAIVIAAIIFIPKML